MTKQLSIRKFMVKKNGEVLNEDTDCVVAEDAEERRNILVAKHLMKLNDKDSGRGKSLTGTYAKYSDVHRLEIARFAKVHGNAAAVRKYTSIYPKLKESTVRSFKKALLEKETRLRKNDSCQFGDETEVLSLNKNTTTNKRPLKLGDLDAEVISECWKLRSSGGVLDGRVATAIAMAIVEEKRPQMMKTLVLGRGWSNSLFRRMGLTIRHATTGKLQLPDGYVNEKTFTFLRDIALPVRYFNIHDSLIINWDQTPLKYVPTGQFTMAEKGSSKVAINGVADKRAITAVVTVAADGTFLPLQLIYPGLTERCHPKHTFPAGFHITQNKNHWSTISTTHEYIDAILKPYIQHRRDILGAPDMPVLLLFDHFRAHTEQTVVEKLGSLNCKIVTVPKNMTDILQPLDVAINKPIKDFMKNKFSLWYSQVVRGQYNDNNQEWHECLSTLLKSSTTIREHHAEWLSELFEHFQLEQQQEIVRRGFAKVGILDFIKNGELDDNPFKDLLN